MRVFKRKIQNILVVQVFDICSKNAATAEKFGAKNFHESISFKWVPNCQVWSCQMSCSISVKILQWHKCLLITTRNYFHLRQHARFVSVLCFTLKLKIHDVLNMWVIFTYILVSWSTGSNCGITAWYVFNLNVVRSFKEIIFTCGNIPGL